MANIDNWDKIRKHFSKSFATSMHVSMATLNQNQQPHISPIGTFFLNEDYSGFYFEQYTRQLPRAAEQNRQVCILAVNSSKWLWLKSLFKGQFFDHPGIRLFGELGQRRKAKPQEIHALQRRMRATRRLKGHQMLWKDLDQIREVKIIGAEPMKIGAMTNKLYTI